MAVAQPRLMSSLLPHCSSPESGHLLHRNSASLACSFAGLVLKINKGGVLVSGGVPTHRRF